MSSREVISSWKCIAEFLKREVRTAQRWEQTRGLPVHRTPGDSRAVVYAFREELEDWLRSSTRTDGVEHLSVFREIFMRAPEAMWLLDDERRYREVNDAGCQLLGVTRDHLLGKQIDDFAGESERRGLPRLWNRFVQERDLAGEFRFVTLGGELVTTSFLARADIVPGLHLGIFRESTRKKLSIIPAA